MHWARFLVLAFVLALPSIGHAQDDGSEIHSAVSRYVVYRDRGMTDQAQFTIEQAANRFPDSAPVQLALAESHHLAGNKAEAKAAYDRALAMEPDNVVAKANRAELLEGSSPIRAFHPPSREPLIGEDMIAAYEHLVDYVRSADAELSRMLEEVEGEELRHWLGSGPGRIYQPEETVDGKFRRHVDQRMEELKESLAEFEVSSDTWTEQTGEAKSEIKDAQDKAALHDEWTNMEVSEEYLEKNRDRVEQLQQEMTQAQAEADRFQKAADAAVRGNSNRETVMANVDAARKAKRTYERLHNEYERLLNPKKFQLAREFAEENREKVWDLFEAEDKAGAAWHEAKERWNQLEEKHGSSSEEALAAQEVTNEKYWAWKEAEKAYRNATPSLERRAEQQRRAHEGRARDELRRRRVAEQKLTKLDTERDRTSESLRKSINWAYQVAIESHWRSYSSLTSIRICLRIGLPYTEEIRAIRAEYDKWRNHLLKQWKVQEWTQDQFCMAMQNLYSNLRPKELQVHHRYRAQFHAMMRRYFLREREMFEITREFANSEDGDGRRREIAAKIGKNLSDRTLGDARWGPNGFARMTISELRWPSMCDSVGGIPPLEPSDLDFRGDSLTNGVFEDYATISGDSLEKQLTAIVRKRWESMREWEKEAIVKSLTDSKEGTEALRDAFRGDRGRAPLLRDTLIAVEKLHQSSRGVRSLVPTEDEESTAIEMAFKAVDAIPTSQLIAKLFEKGGVDEKTADGILDYIKVAKHSAALVLRAFTKEGIQSEDALRFLDFPSGGYRHHPAKNALPLRLAENNLKHVERGFALATEEIEHLGDENWPDRATERAHRWGDNFGNALLGVDHDGPMSEAEAAGAVITTAILPDPIKKVVDTVIGWFKAPKRPR